MHPLISVEELAGRLDEVAVFDVRWALTDPNHGRNAYRDGHIPGAVFVDLDKDLSAPPGPGRHPLPSVDEWETTLGQLGVSPDTGVVAYDDVGGAVAARMWWMLRSVGHTMSRLLDGGYQAWVEAGMETETGENIPDPTTYKATHDFTGVVTHAELDGRTLIDVRAPERYQGETEPVDPKPGHIPGAVNLPVARNLDETRRFRDPSSLRSIFGEVSDRPVVACGSGVNACHTAAAMVAAGLAMPDVYVGSYSEWSRLDLPVRIGDEP